MVFCIMAKVDFIKDDKELYAPSKKEPSIVEVPKFKFLMIDGQGDPNTATSYKQAVEALYSTAYTLKFLPRKGVEIDGYFDYKVPPLEGLWWMDNNEDFVLENKDDWQWTMMIRQPEFVTEDVLKLAIEAVKKKKSNPRIDEIRVEEYEEGTSVQLMHIGPYSEEHENIMRMHKYAEEQGYKLHSKHHEIYLSDPRKSKPENLKTVLRQPITK